jgi:propanol-preferring alcohol dehydrogenase
VCGVCRTDLDLVDGRLIAPTYPLVPGHQIVGRVAAIGRGVEDWRDGDVVGVAWIHSACGVCEWCVHGQENLCPRFEATGCDADGGFAEFAVVPAKFAHVIPSGIAPLDCAPLLCAGAIGWRALHATALRDGEPLGLTGFGASAHLVLQLARQRYPSSPVFVFARNADDRAFAKSLGAQWAGEIGATPPEPLAAIIDTTPAWTPVVAALSALRPGGRLVINAITKDARDHSALLELDYTRHLWREREIKSVANVTRLDVREFLGAVAAWWPAIRATVTALPLDAANDALATLRSGAARGALALQVASS